MKAREVRRAKLVAKYAEKRAALKQIVRTGDPAEAFEAADSEGDPGPGAHRQGGAGRTHPEPVPGSPGKVGHRSGN